MRTGDVSSFTDILVNRMRLVYDVVPFFDPSTSYFHFHAPVFKQVVWTFC